MASGATDPDIAPALANVVAAGHNIIISPFCTQTTLTALRTHLDFVSGPMEQRRGGRRRLAGYACRRYHAGVTNQQRSYYGGLA
jgi:phage tail sheath gpL-like